MSEIWCPLCLAVAWCVQFLLYNLIIQHLDLFDPESDFSGGLSDEELVEVPSETDPWYGISMLVVWNPLFLDPSDGVFGRFDLAALCGCHTFNVCYVMLFKHDITGCMLLPFPAPLSHVCACSTL